MFLPFKIGEMNKIWFLTYGFLIFCLFTTCEKGYIKEDPTEEQPAGSDTGYEGVKEDDDDYTWSRDDAVQIVLNGNFVSADTSIVAVNGTNVTITTSGTYQVSGILNDGQLRINTEDKEDIKIILDNVSITCSSSAPLYISRAKKVIVCLADDSKNILTDGSVYTNLVGNEPNATFFSKSDLILFGNGSLTVNANYNDGISSKDGLIIKSCCLIVNSIDDGIRGKDYLIVHSGDITINSGGDGLKSDNEEDISAGFIIIDTGSFTIESGGDAIVAATDIVITAGDFDLTSGGGNKMVYGTSSAKSIKGLSGVSIFAGNFTINSADGAIHSNGKCVFTGGTLSLSSGDDGIHADEGVAINRSNINIIKSYEGIESAAITIDQSTVRIVSSDVVIMV
jgi:hypothetical protein